MLRDAADGTLDLESITFVRSDMDARILKAVLEMGRYLTW